MPEDEIEILRRVVAEWESAIAEIQEEARIVGKFAASESHADLVAAENFATQALYRGMKLAVVGAGTKAAIEALESDLNRLRLMRRGSLLKMINALIKGARRRLLSPLWIGSQVAALTKLDQLESEMSELGENEKRLPEIVPRLHQMVARFDDIVKMAELERESSRRRAPVLTLLWGIPIWIGVIASGRLGFLGNFASLLLLFVVAGVIYLIAGRRRLGGIDAEEKTRAKPLMERLLLGSLIPFLAIIFPLIVIGVMSRSVILGWFSGEHVGVESTRIEARPGASVSNDISVVTDDPLFAVKGFLVQPMVGAMEVASISLVPKGRSVIKANVEVPEDVPPGTYRAKLQLSYKIKSPVQWIYSDHIEKISRYDMQMVVHSYEEEGAGTSYRSD